MSNNSAGSSNRDDVSPAPAVGRDALVASLLSAVAGYVDTAGFVGLFGLFTAHVTGNLVTVGSAMAYKDGRGTGPRLAMLPIFMVAVAATVLIIRWLRQRDRAILAPLLCLEALALAIFLLSGVLLAPQVEHDHGGWAIAAIGACGVVAMGIQNALMREVMSSSAPTTMMTGNVTQFTIDLTNCLLPGSGAQSETSRVQARKRLVKTGGILLGFVAGAALGAVAMRQVGFWSIAVPTLAVCALATRV